MKFKVGDFVKGVYGHYFITNGDMKKGVITHIYKNKNEVIVKVLEHKNEKAINQSFPIDMDTFDKYFLPLKEENEL